MTNFDFEALRKGNRENLHRIWQKARKGKLEGLTEEEQRLGKVMLQHSDEYFNQFEFADVTAEREFDPGTEVNPFLHVTLHAVIEKQLEDRHPIEPFQFYNAMIKNNCTRHEAIHLLMTILVRFLASAAIRSARCTRKYGAPNCDATFSPSGRRFSSAPRDNRWKRR